MTRVKFNFFRKWWNTLIVIAKKMTGWRLLWLVLMIIAVISGVIVLYWHTNFKNKNTKLIESTISMDNFKLGEPESIKEPILQNPTSRLVGSDKFKAKFTAAETYLEFKSGSNQSFWIKTNMKGLENYSNQPTTKAESTIYSEVLLGVDIERKLYEGEVKELITLKNPSASKEYVFDLSNSPELNIYDYNGLIIFTNQDKHSVAKIDRPVATDNNGKTFNFKYVLANGSLKLSPDSDLSTAIYPLVIDPSVQISDFPANQGGTEKSGKIVRDKAGNYYTIYSKRTSTNTSTPRNIYISKSTNEGASWTETQITSDTTQSNGWPSMVIDSNDNLFAVWGQGTGLGDIGLSATLRYTTFAASTLGTTPAIQNVGTGGLVNDLLVDSSNNVYLMAQSATSIFYSKYTKSSSSWGSRQTIESSTTNCGSQHGSMSISSADIIHLVWDRQGTSCPNDAPGIYYTSLNGSTLGTPIMISGQRSIVYLSGSDVFPQIVVDPSDNVNVIWRYNRDAGNGGGDPLGSIASSIMFTSKSAGGWSWSDERILSTGGGLADYQGGEGLSTDASGNLYIAYNIEDLSANCVKVDPDPYWHCTIFHDNYELQYITRQNGTWDAAPRVLFSDPVTNIHPYFIGAFINSKFPKVSGVSTNIPSSGAGFTYIHQGVGLAYYGSPVWPSTPPPSQMQVVLTGDYSVVSPSIIQGSYNSYINRGQTPPPNYNLYLYCDRNDDSWDYNIITPDARVLGDSDGAISWGSNCRYSPGQTYYPKIIAEQGSVVREAHKQIVVQTLADTLRTTPASGGTANARRMVATGTGTATGPFNYTFWYNCAEAGNDIAILSQPSHCGDPTRYGEVYTYQTNKTFTTPTPHNFSAGTYNLKVIVTSPTGRFLPAEASYTLVVNVRDILDVKSVTPSPSSGPEPLLPSLTINYETNHTYGFWDVRVYCSPANRNPIVHGSIPDANVGPAPGKSSPWFSGTINLASDCSYTGSGNRQMTVEMVASDDSLIIDGANPVINLTVVTYSLQIYATGPGSTASIRGVLDSNQPTGTSFRYTMYCDRNDSANTVTSGWKAQTTSTSRDLVLGTCDYVAPGQNYYPKIVVEYPVGTVVASAKTVYNYTNPVTLAASITANPNPGVTGRPISLNATVTGTESGNINYSFYCKNTDASPAVTFTNVAGRSQAAPNACTYSSAGTYYPKIIVIMTGSGSTAQGQTTLAIGPPTVSVTLSAIPGTVSTSQPVSLEAQVAGTAQGNITYDFYCVDTATAYTKRVISANTTMRAENLCSYTTTGANRAKVVVTREAITATKQATIQVSATGINGQIIFEGGGDPIKIRGSLVANSVVFNARNKGGQAFSVRIFSDKNVLASRLPGFSTIMSIINANQ